MSVPVYAIGEVDDVRHDGPEFHEGSNRTCNNSDVEAGRGAILTPLQYYF
jgi:hypothetical protein